MYLCVTDYCKFYWIQWYKFVEKTRAKIFNNYQEEPSVTCILYRLI